MRWPTQTAKHAKIALKRLRVVRSARRSSARIRSAAQGYEFDVPLLPGEHVTADTGTGFVHTAPGHGEEDFELMIGDLSGLCREQSRRLQRGRTRTARSTANVPLFAGKRILTPEGKDGDANGAVIKELIAAGELLAKGSLRHSISALAGAPRRR